MKKRNRLFVCLVAGVLILAVSATAAFGQRQWVQQIQGSSEIPGAGER